MEIPALKKDNEIWVLIEAANKQYDNYLKLNLCFDSLKQDSLISEPEYTWDHPLTLIITR